MTYYNEICCDEMVCADCEILNEKIEETKGWIQYLIEQIYSNKELDLNEFERSLDELCGTVGLRLPAGEIALERKQYLLPKHINQTKQEILSDWIDFNQKYLKQLA